LNDDVAYIAHDHFNALARHHVLSGDILVAALGDPVGRACLAPSNLGPSLVKADCFRVRLSPELPAAWLMLWLNSDHARTAFSGSAHGLGRMRINLSDLRTTIVPVPPRSEQRRIVAKIDSLSGKSKLARDQLDHVRRLVQKYKQAILAAAFRGDLTREWRDQQAAIESASDLIKRTEEPLQSRGGREATTDVKPGIAGLSVNAPETEPPPNWVWVRLRRVARQETGHTPSRSHPEYWDGGVPWIGIPDAGNHHGQVIHQTLQTVSDQGLANSSARLLPEGTVCLSRTASVGYVTIMGRPMATSQDFATWTCTPALVPKYLMFALMAEGENIRKFGEGSTHTTIYFPEIRALHICLAPLAEQQEIVAKVEKALAWIDRLASEATSARSLIDRLDQAVLVKAFQGELVPQDPNDEPASVLLERIRSERRATSTPRSRDEEARASETAIRPKRIGRRRHS
jgi:type I restriction enzyme S subunit